ncbi:hypothetical protein EGI20_07655 [Aquitalea sp. S1-19]|nr:hypothetical protein [Aquitalea sp. S1-19]
MKPFEHLADDPFFRWSEDSEWNACIGPQGHEENYIDGYMEAATLLANSVVEQKLYISRDTLVLPILYNARHAIELTLKFVVARLHAENLYSLKKTNHNISDYLTELQRENLGDWEMRSLLESLSPYVSSLSAIDNDGQQLRFAKDKSGIASLSERPLANFEVIRSSLAELGDVLRKIKSRVQDFCEESRTGTFTKSCSRSDLKFIASEMAPYPTLGSPDFLEAKERVKLRFSFGNRPFQEAYDDIIRSREFGAYLGQTFELNCLSDKHAKFFVSGWAKLHPPRPEGESGCRIVRSSELREIMMASPSSRPVASELTTTLSIDDLADVETIYYLGRDNIFPEFYEAHFATTKKEYQVASDLIGKVQHVLSKTNFLNYFSRGVRRLGRPELADELIAMRPDLS